MQTLASTEAWSANADQFNAFFGFANGLSPPGPFTATGLHSGLPPVPRVSQNHAPYSDVAAISMKGCCEESAALLSSCFAGHIANPSWGGQFWEGLRRIDVSGRLAPGIRPLPQQYGYSGSHVAAPTLAPSMPELFQALQFLASHCLPPHGTGAVPFTPPGVLTASSGDSSWDSLPADYKRSGWGIYRSIRSSGFRSVRDWLTHSYSGSRKGPLWTDLWHVATAADFSIQKAASVSEAEAFRVINSDDNLELGLRRLASQVLL